MTPEQEEEERRAAKEQYDSWCRDQGYEPDHGPWCDDDNLCAECRCDEAADWHEERRYR